ncbi:hypothetical protein QE449_001097 [Rhodococcus sp. SORGH_AS303]|nr:hypothetical protein [Rhodococcus sp. SORGH_AS_0303]
MANTVEITDRVERLESLEERFKISLEGLYVVYEGGSSPRVRANFDVVSRGDVPDYLQVHVSAYNEKGQLIGTGHTYVNEEDFVGLKSCSEDIKCPAMPVRVRIYPSKT